MKKILVLITSLLLAVAMVGCSKTNLSIFGASYFLSNSSAQGIVDVNETNVYSISFEASENAGAVISVDSEKSSYTTVLTASTYGESKTPCYLLETELKVVGTITCGEDITPLDDHITTKCYFLGTSDSLKPLYSERTVVANSIVLTSQTADNATYSVYAYDYSISIKYADDDAQTSVKINKKPESDTRFTEDIATTFENYKDGAYIDNEILLFAPRAMTLSTVTNKSFSTIDVISKANHEMTLTSITDEPTKTIEFTDSSYFRNGERVPSVLCYGVQFAIDSDASGSLITCYYAETETQASERASMIMAKTSAPYNLGTYTYLIKSAQTNQN